MKVPTSPQPATVLVTGASGFVGSHVLRQLRSSAAEINIRVLSRTGLPLSGETHLGDLRSRQSLAGVAEGVDVVVHCASYVGSSTELAILTNVAGTQALIEEARKSRVQRLLYVSTAAVYGRGPFHNQGGASLKLAPTSVLSSTRARAERLILDEGGSVLRPHLLFGTGDKWLGPRAMRLARLLQGRVAGFNALLSMVDVRRVAEAVVQLALLPPDARTAQVYDCNHPDPVPAAVCLNSFMRLGKVAPSPDSMDLALARERLCGQVGPLHDLEMLSADHWFDSTPLWAAIDLPPGPPFQVAVTDHREWYAARA